MWQKIGNWLVGLLLVLILGRFAIQTYGRMLTNSNSSEGDQLAFLQLGLDFREQGVITDGTRNPLYAAFLATFAQRQWAYFTYAKLLSLSFGLLAILATFLLGRRYFDTFTGLAAAYLLSINVEFIVHSATALTESLLVLTFILAGFAMFKALDAMAMVRYWLLAGLLGGLAYQAKGSGQLLILSFLIIAFIFHRFSLFRTRSLWLFLAGYALVAAPLWIYNTVHYGSPNFNYAITHQMWMNSWNDWHPDNVDNLPTAITYFQNHTVSEIAARQWTGMKAMRNTLIKTLWPTRTLMVDRFLLSPAGGYVLAMLALLPLIFWPFSRRYVHHNRSAIYLTTLVTVIFFLLFAWYDSIVALGSRFLLPIIPFIFLLFAHIFSRLGQNAMSRGIWPKRLVILTGAIILILQVQWAARTNVDQMLALFSQNVFAQDRKFNDDAATPLAWLARESSEPSNVAWGPSGNSLPTWAFSDQLNFELYPPGVNDIPEFTRNLVDRDIEYVIIAPDMISKHRSLLKTQFPSDGARVEITDIPTDWALTFAYRSMPCDWCIFRLRPSSPPENNTTFQIGQGILLTGYDLDQTSYRPGDTLLLTLHWTAQTAPEQELTVFTQLLGPDFQLHGQMDHQPIDNLWPTSRWQPGQQLADRYEIPIDPNAPAGEYWLLVGMYDAASGQRQPITQGGESVPDNAILLTTVSITPN